MQTARPLSTKQMAFLMAMLIAIMPLSIDAYLPSLPNIATALQADIHQIEKSLSTFMFGVAAGQLLGGSLSDIKGRRNIALFGLTIFLIGCAGLIFVQNAEQLMALRMVQALGGGMSAVVVGALVRDNYQGKEAAQMFTLIGIILMMAPLVAPMLGSVLQSLTGWRSIFAFLFVYAAIVFALLFRFLPKHKSAEPLRLSHVKQIGSRYRQVFATLPALGFLFYQAASFSSMMAFLSESPFVYMKLYNLSSHQYAWVFGCNIVTMMLCNRLTAFGLRRDWHSRDLLSRHRAARLRQYCPCCQRVVVQTAAAGVVDSAGDGVGGHARLNRRQHASIVYEQLSPRGGRQCQRRAIGNAIADWLAGGLFGCLFAQWHSVGDDRHDARRHQHRLGVAAAVFARADVGQGSLKAAGFNGVKTSNARFCEAKTCLPP